ncbi:MAG: Ribosomal RNA small subunit methyltransferase A [Candidatus Giovannonibacteria bacterium GW2011_GWC2_44_8]|uniref:Ribosomal RNA small subunit methyltransferase A n=1 Tax=Candidatus Giovannonibacteria bacterium GW2011_GWC2_44_8 TaxID=1618657 RepID=A0A0G1JZN9_9BACT|nr:MAG: Ribosomal RNA small subunit methyltransferase A [Parcubacteria group bacterium GW2011_GWB1_43_6]KKT76855.1 MAG: Ribosomal RNA small subunit methyltransferase A [Candidatus Giovannonibacteria bacterium GW2011_GWC2_44_8]
MRVYNRSVLNMQLVIFIIKMAIELTNKRIIKYLLEKYNAKPEKYLGQHFILSKKALKKMIETAQIKTGDTIVEIGPGLGTLTEKLAETGANIVAIEKDSLMVEILKETVAGYKNVKIIQADARQIWRGSPEAARQLLMSDTNSFGDNVGINGGKYGYKIVANLPYNAATFLIRQWLESENPPQMMVLMIQKEVARRIVAKPPHSNLLGISVQFYADAKIIDYIKKESFWPKPKVDAAIIKIIPHSKKKLAAFASDRKQMMTGNAKEIFFKILKAGFSQPRKQLFGNFAKKLNIPKERLILIFKNLDISEKIRAENLSLNDWQKLAFELIHN